MINKAVPKKYSTEEPSVSKPSLVTNLLGFQLPQETAASWQFTRPHARELVESTLAELGMLTQ